MAALTASLVFGNCCGTIIALVMPRVAPLFARKPFPWSWVYYLSTLLVLSAIGCLISVFILTRIGAFRPADFWIIFRFSLVVAAVIALVIGVSRYLYEGLRHRLEVATRKLQLKELEQKLDPARFIRIHRSTLLNLDHVQEVHSWFAGGVVVRLKDEKRTELPVARDRVRALKQRLGF